MFDATLLDSSPARTPILTARHWVAALCVGIMGALAGFVIVPMISDPSPRALGIESTLLGAGVMFYELMIWYVLTDARHLGLNSGRWSVALLLLNVVGFVAYLIYSAEKTGEWKRATLPLAYVFQGIVVCGMLLFPLVSTQALPDAHRLAEFWIPSAPAGRPPVTTSHVRTVSHRSTHPTMEAPIRIPRTIDMVREKPDASKVAPQNYPFVPGEIDAGSGGTGQNPVPIGWLVGVRDVGSPPVTPHPAQHKPMRVGGRVEEALLIFHPNPEYPALAKMAGIQGTVVLEAIISRDGTIQDLKAISGHPILIPAALDAVRHWRYRPTLLDGDPVEVVTEVQVHFILNE